MRVVLLTLFCLVLLSCNDKNDTKTEDNMSHLVDQLLLPL